MSSSKHTVPESETLPPSAGSSDVFVLPASLGQERFWALDRLNPGNPTWNVPVRFRLQGPLDVSFVERAFNEIIRRHETLRTTFGIEEGKPVQVIKPSLTIEVPVTDLRQIPKPERDAEVDKLSFKEARWRFDLATGPLFRASLLRIDDNEHVLLVTPHHSMIDYWSIGLISNELGALYDGYSRGVAASLPDLPIQYGDFAVWQREQTTSEVVQKELANRKSQLKDLPLVEFPTDHPRLASPTYEATITSILLPVTLTDAIKDIANREGATFFNTMLAALAIVIHRYTKQTDFGVSTQVAGRSSVELESLIGLFINTVVLRMDLSGDPPFSQLVARVQQVGMESITNQNLRFEQLLQELRPKDYPSHHTLFRLNFICQRDPVKPLEFAGIKLTVIPSKSQGALYELNVFLVLRNEGWRLACEYNTDLFEANTVTRLLSDYRAVLEALAENPNRRLSEISSLLNPPIPQSLGAAAVIQVGAAETIAPPAVIASEAANNEPYVMPTSAAQKRFWVLEEIEHGNPALHMRACLRLKGTIWLALLERSLQSLVDRHETLRTTFERLDDDLVQVITPRLRFQVPLTSLEDVPEDNIETKLREAIRRETGVSFDMARGPLIRARLFRLKADEHVLVITTHHVLVDGWSQNLIQRDLWTTYEALCQGRDPSLPPLAVQYGDFVEWQNQWLTSEDAQKSLDFWKKQLAPPLALLNLPIQRPVHNGSGRSAPMESLLLPEELTRSLKSVSQSLDVTMFMLTLTCFGALLHRYTGQEEILIGSPMANRKPETEQVIGPFAGPVSLRLNLSGNPSLRELLDRVRETTFDALSHTDLPFEVILEKSGVRSVHGRNPLSQTYFFYQTAFLQPRELSDLTVTPMADFGQGTHFELQLGLLERREGVRCQLEYNPELFGPDAMRSILQDYESVLEIMQESPEVRVRDLPVSLRLHSAPIVEPDTARPVVTRPKNETEKKLSKIWEDLLGARQIGLHQNYFDLGGNSLLAVRLFDRIEKTFGVNLPLSTLFETQTIEDFAIILDRKDATHNGSSLVAIQAAGSRPRFFCIHGGGGHILIYRDLSRHLGVDQPFYGLQAQGLDGRQACITKIEDMAALYAREIRKIQPHGPYFLGGYCMGGTVALELAQQLSAAGEQVALLALFDTLNWAELSPASAWNRTVYQGQRLVFHARNFLLLDFQNKLRFFQEKVKVLRSRIPVWRGLIASRFKKNQVKEVSGPDLLARIWSANDEAAMRYVPRPYPGVITTFRPIKQYSRYLERSLDWDRLALEGCDVVTLPVYPAGMLLEPFVKDLAIALKAAIDKAIRTNSA